MEESGLDVPMYIKNILVNKSVTYGYLNMICHSLFLVYLDSFQKDVKRKKKI